MMHSVERQRIDQLGMPVAIQLVVEHPSVATIDSDTTIARNEGGMVFLNDRTPAAMLHWLYRRSHGQSGEGAELRRADYQEPTREDALTAASLIIEQVSGSSLKDLGIKLESF